MDLEIIKTAVVNASSFINKAKMMAREADVYLNKLSDQVLPRCRSTDITSNIMKRLFGNVLQLCIYYVFIKFINYL